MKKRIKKAKHNKWVLRGDFRLNEFEYAGFWKRVGATILDCVILGPIGFILCKIFPFAWMENINTILNLFLIIWFNSSVYQGTPGKIILGVKVTNLNGERISFLKSMGRSMFYFPIIGFNFLGIVALQFIAKQGNTLLFILVLVGLICSGFLPIIGYIMVAFTEKKQGLHDKIFGTLVINKIISQSETIQT